MREYCLKGVRIQEIKLLPDERGFFGEALRIDWKEFMQEEQVKQVNLSCSYPDIIRAWHKHAEGQIDYFLVIKGAMKICAYEETTGKMAEIIATENKPTVVRVPGKYLHGTKTISNTPSLLVYFVNRLYNYENPDEIRTPWNSESVVPTEINGNKEDPRVGRPWEWFRPPHK